MTVERTLSRTFFPRLVTNERTDVLPPLKTSPSWPAIPIYFFKSTAFWPLNESPKVLLKSLAAARESRMLVVFWFSSCKLCCIMALSFSFAANNCCWVLTTAATEEPRSAAFAASHSSLFVCLPINTSCCLITSNDCCAAEIRPIAEFLTFE